MSVVYDRCRLEAGTVGEPGTTIFELELQVVLRIDLFDLVRFE